MLKNRRLMLGLHSMKYLLLICCLYCFAYSCQKNRTCACTIATNWNDTTGQAFERSLVAKHNIIAASNKKAQYYCGLGDQNVTTTSQHTLTGKTTTTVSTTLCKIEK